MLEAKDDDQDALYWRRALDVRISVGVPTSFFKYALAHNLSAHQEREALARLQACDVGPRNFKKFAPPGAP